MWRFRAIAICLIAIGGQGVVRAAFRSRGFCQFQFAADRNDDARYEDHVRYDRKPKTVSDAGCDHGPCAKNNWAWTRIARCAGTRAAWIAPTRDTELPKRSGPCRRTVSTTAKSNARLEPFPHAPQHRVRQDQKRHDRAELRACWHNRFSGQWRLERCEEGLMS